MPAPIHPTARCLRALPLAALLLLAACGGPEPRAFVTQPLTGRWRVAVLPLANYAPARDAVDRMTPMLMTELGKLAGVEVIDPGRVEDALAQEPWLLMDRVPPDLVDRLGQQLGADALMLGSLLAYGYREDGDGRTPQVSLSLRLLEVPGGRILWSVVHSRDGADSEWLFGMGREQSLERLAATTLGEALQSLPTHGGDSPASGESKDDPSTGETR
jgi:hypothetical protein